MEDDTQVIGLDAEELDRSIGSFRALCFEHVKICKAINHPELHERALVMTEMAFVDCLASLWNEAASNSKPVPTKAKGSALRSASRR